MTGNRHFEKDIGLDLGDAQVQKVQRDVEHEEAAGHAGQTHDRGDGDDALHVPAHRLGGQGGVVVGDRHDGDVVEKRQQDDHDGRYGVEVEHHHRQDHENHDPNGFRDAVDGITVHALEYAPGFFHGPYQNGEARRREHQVGGRPGGIGGAADRDPQIGLFEGRRVVDAVTGHTDDVPLVLEGPDDFEFVLGVDLRESVGLLGPGSQIRTARL